MLCPSCRFNNSDDVTACVSCGTPLSGIIPPPNLLTPGSKLLNGAYTVGKLLGQGGFGITYLGSDVSLNRPVAIKEFFPAGCTRQGSMVLPAGGWTTTAYTEAKQRFLQEGQTLAQFNHPGIVHVYTAFEQNNTAYIVMEYLRGKSLAAVLQERSRRMSEQEAVGYIEPVGAALEVVHQTGFLHRDIKPENIMICVDGRVVLVDFGTAREYAAGQTQIHSVTLTPGYAPLEQYTQLAKRGPYTDIYALTATLYHLLTGNMPASATDRIAGVTLSPVRQLNPQVSEVVSQAVLQGLEMEVARRPQSVREFLNMLRGRGVVKLSQPSPSAQPSDQKTRQLEGHTDLVNSIAFSPDGKFLASGSRDKTIRLWEVTTGHEVRRLEGHTDWVNSVVFSPDGRLLASGSFDNTVRLWNVSSGHELKLLHGLMKSVQSVDFSPDNRILASANHKRVLLWNVLSGHEIRRLEEHSDLVNSIAFSPDGRLLASGSHKIMSLWEVSTGYEARRLEGHTYSVMNLAFSPDGMLLASASRDNTVRLWEVSTGCEVRRLEGHAAPVMRLAFSPDGMLLASAGEDNTVRLWEVSTGCEVRRLEGYAYRVRSVAFSPDGKLLAGNFEDIIHLWDV